MKRLVKKSLMNPEMFQGTIDQLGQKGRAILKNIEEYKFALEQAARIVANDQMLAQKFVQKKSEVDKAAGQIYSIVFDIENIDITQAFEQQQNMVNNPEQAQPEGQEVPNIPEQPNAPETPESSAPVGGGPAGGGETPTPEDAKETEETEKKDEEQTEVPEDEEKKEEK